MSRPLLHNNPHLASELWGQSSHLLLQIVVVFAASVGKDHEVCLYLRVEQAHRRLTGQNRFNILVNAILKTNASIRSSTYHLVVLCNVAELVDGDEVHKSVCVQLLGLGDHKVFLMVVCLESHDKHKCHHCILLWAQIKVPNTFLKTATVSEETL